MSSNNDQFANYISSSEAAGSFGVSTSYITELARKGAVKAFKFGKMWIVEKDSLQSYLSTPHKRGPKGPRKKTSSRLKLE